MAVGNNQNHVQISKVEATRVWLDVARTVSWEPEVTADTEDIQADGGIYATAYGPPVGEGNLTFVDSRFANFVVLNGGTLSSSGTGNSVIERYEELGTYIPVPFSIADWSPNIAKNREPTIAGMRITVPSATSGLINRSGGQESTQEWTAPTRFTKDPTTDILRIFEKLATAPTFTPNEATGVMPVNLTPPA